MKLKVGSRYKLLYKIYRLSNIELTSRLCKEGASRELAIIGYYKHSFIGKRIKTHGFTLFPEFSIWQIGCFSWFVAICLNLEAALNDIGTGDLDFWLDVDDHSFRLQFLKAELVSEPLTANLPEIVVRGEDKSILEPERYGEEELRLPSQAKKPTGEPNIPRELIPKKTFTFPLPPLTYGLEEEEKKKFPWFWALFIGGCLSVVALALTGKEKKV